jgi:hypothetical protein
MLMAGLLQTMHDGNSLPGWLVNSLYSCLWFSGEVKLTSTGSEAVTGTVTIHVLDD